MKYYIGYIASWNGKLSPMVYSKDKKRVQDVLADWSDRETKIERIEDTQITALMCKYPSIEFTGLKRL